MTCNQISVITKSQIFDYVFKTEKNKEGWEKNHFRNVVGDVVSRSFFKMMRTQMTKVNREYEE